MAIPFVFPSDEDTEANYNRLDQLLSDLFDVLQQILITQRRIRESQPSHIASRIRNGQSTCCRRHNDDFEASSSSSSSDFVSSEARISADFGRMALQPATSSSASSLITNTTTDHADLLRFSSPMAHGRSPSRRRRRRRRTASESSCCDEAKDNGSVNVGMMEVAATQTTTTTQDWSQVGVNLRQIADDFYASVGKEETTQVSEDSKRPCGVESTNPADASLLSMLVPPPFGGSIWTAVIFVVGWRLLARAR